MRGLSGDVGTMSLRDLTVFLGNRKATGVLLLERGPVSKRLEIAEGQVVSASTNQPREYLGQFLINMGLLTEDQFNRAYETQKETRIFLGRILVMIGVVNEEQVSAALRLKFRETLLSAFEWPDGEFVFTPGDPPIGMGIEERVDLLDIAREGEFRQTAWHAIRAAFPSGDLRLAVQKENLPETAPGSIDHKLLELIEEGHTLEEMVLALHATDFFVYQRLYALYRLEAVRPRPAEPREALEQRKIVADSGASAEELTAQAEKLLKQGNARDASELSQHAYELKPNAERKSLLDKANAAYLRQLRAELLETDWVPALNLTVAEVKRLALSAPQRYLLSRVDGERTLRAIVQVSPIPELDALRAFREFLESNLVRLGKKAA